MNKHTHFLSRFGVPGIVRDLPSQLSKSVPMKVLNIQMKKQTWGEDQTIQPSLGMFCGKVGKPRVGRSCAPPVWFSATEVLELTGLAPFLLVLVLGQATL